VTIFIAFAGSHDDLVARKIDIFDMTVLLGDPTCRHCVLETPSAVFPLFQGAAGG